MTERTPTCKTAFVETSASGSTKEARDNVAVRCLPIPKDHYKHAAIVSIAPPRLNICAELTALVCASVVADEHFRREKTRLTAAKRSAATSKPKAA